MTEPVDIDDLDEHSVPRAKPTVFSVELDGEAVLLDDETGTVHSLNPIATLVWSCLDGSGSVGELIDDLADAFAGTDRATVSDDVLSLVRTLGELGLLDGVRPSTEAGA